MKFATIREGSRDGRLAVVSKDLSACRIVGDDFPTLQAALDKWALAEPALAAASERLAAGDGSQPFDAADAMSPLPRAYQWADGSAYINHVELVRRARGVEMPPSFFTDPLIYQGGSDSFLGPREPILAADESLGIDLEGEVAVIVDDVPMGASPALAAGSIRLIMLTNDITMRGLTPSELAKGFGFFQSKPSSAFSPVAVTPDELGEAWDGHRLHLPLCIDVNGVPFGRANAGVDMTFGFPELISHAARTRPLTAGSIIGSGTVSNKFEGEPGRPVSAGGAGYSCLAEIRMVETIQDGEPSTPFLRFGDTVKIWVDDAEGQSVFGAIEQTAQQYGGP